MQPKPRARCLLLLLSLCLVGLALSPAARADAIDDFVQAQMAKQHVPGVAVGVVLKGHFVKEKGYGLADVERNVPVTTDTVFEIGSVTKQFTATAIMMLVDGGKIGLDDKISRYRDGLPEAWKAVTIRQLLSHTSGIPDYEAIMGYGSYRNIMTANQVIALAASKPMDFAPGTRWNYSNTGYFLLTLALEKITSQPYIQFLQAHILTPLGMTHTRSSEPRDIIPQRAAGYAYENGHLENRDAIQPTATGGAAMLVSTLGDMAKWGAEILTPTLLREKDYDLMWANTPLADGTPSGYGFGWFVGPKHGHRALEHSGGTAGFTCDMLWLLDDRAVVMVLTNGYQSTARPTPILDFCAATFVHDLAERPLPRRASQVTGMGGLNPALEDVMTDQVKKMTDWVRPQLFSICVFALFVEWVGFGSCHFADLADTQAEIPGFIPKSARMFTAVVTGMLEVTTGLLILVPRTQKWAALSSLVLLTVFWLAVYNMMANDAAIPGGATFRQGVRIILVPNNVLLTLCAAYIWRQAPPTGAVKVIRDLFHSLQVAAPPAGNRASPAAILTVAAVMLAANVAGFVAILASNWHGATASFWGMMCLATGALVGFLFGIPRVNVKAAENDVYRPNTNIEDVSDWLTKIIVGVGLVEFRKIGVFLHELAAGLGKALTTAPAERDGAAAFALALIVYFFVAGMIQGYLLTRLYLTQQFTAVTS